MYIARDKRGRLRSTVNGLRVELSPRNQVRIYRRYAHGHPNTERRQDMIDPAELGSLVTAANRLRDALRREGNPWI